MTATPEALQAAAIDIRVKANELASAAEAAVLLTTALAIRKGGVDDQVAEAVAAERERCAQFADKEAAKLRAGDSPEWMEPCAATLEDFAALLREAQP